MYSILAFGIGTQEIILTLVVVIVLFGATKIPQLGAGIGQGIKNFKRGMREVREEEEEAQKKEEQKELEGKGDKDSCDSDRDTKDTGK